MTFFRILSWVALSSNPSRQNSMLFFATNSKLKRQPLYTNCPFLDLSKEQSLTWPFDWEAHPGRQWDYIYLQFRPTTMDQESQPIRVDTQALIYHQGTRYWYWDLIAICQGWGSSALHSSNLHFSWNCVYWNSAQTSYSVLVDLGTPGQQIEMICWPY